MKKSNQNCIILLICFVTISACCNTAAAQKLIFLFGNGAYDIATGNTFKNNFKSGLGLDAGAGIGFGKTFFTGTIGYNHFFTQQQAKDSGVHSFSYFPVKLGIRHYLFAKILYANIDAGAGFGKFKDVLNHSDARFTGDVGLGINLTKFELGASYEAFKQPSGWAAWFGLKAGWKIGL